MKHETTISFAAALHREAKRSQNEESISRLSFLFTREGQLMGE